MRKLLAMILCVVSLLTLFGCNVSTDNIADTPVSSSGGTSDAESEKPTVSGDENKPTDTHTEKLPVACFNYKFIDYNGGFTEQYIFDFDNNIVKYRGYLPHQNEEVPLEVLAEFTEEEEAEFLDTLYTNGFFEIDAYYPAPPDIIDGGGWELNVEFCNGTTKKSSGSNNSPVAFRGCATAFFDICGDGVVGYVPQEYYTPPNVSYAIHTFHESMGGLSMIRADYQWNGFEVRGSNVYEISKSIANSVIVLVDGIEYLLVLYTANYVKNEDYDEFQRCTVTSYDYNEEMTGETVLYDGGWFEQIEMRMYLYKLYVVRFEFENGDFVEYTFNTVLASVE